MILDKQKTTEKILSSDFPVDLLRALSSLDVAVRDLERAGDDERAGAEQDLQPMLQEMYKFTVVTISEFRKAWAVYYPTEEELVDEREKETE